MTQSIVPQCEVKSCKFVLSVANDTPDIRKNNTESSLVENSLFLKRVYHITHGRVLTGLFASFNPELTTCSTYSMPNPQDRIIQIN